MLLEQTFLGDFIEAIGHVLKLRSVVGFYHFLEDGDDSSA